MKSGSNAHWVKLRVSCNTTRAQNIQAALKHLVDIVSEKKKVTRAQAANWGNVTLRGRPV
jgi:hypothetical protein